MKKQFLETGKIVATHGIRGEVKIYPWCDSPEFITDFDVLYLDKGATSIPVISSRIHKEMVIAKLEGYDTIEKSSLLKNKIIYINREEVELEEGDYFLQDIMGMKVIDAKNGKNYGKICDFSETGANRVYHIKTENGRELLFPAIEDLVIKKVDFENDLMIISPMEGLFDDED